MRISKLAPILITAALAVAMTGGCEPRNSSRSTSAAATQAEIEAIEHEVSKATGYSTGALEILANPAHLQVEVTDDSLARADNLTRENKAIEIATAVEQAIGAHERFAAIQEISVAIVHPGNASGGEPSKSHVEDVVQFRRGPNQRFVFHIT